MVDRADAARLERRRGRAAVRAQRAADRRARDLALRRRLGRAPGLVFTSSVLVAMGIVLYAAGTPTMDWGIAGWPAAYLGLTFCIWAVRMGQRRCAPPPSDWRTGRAWFYVPVIAGVLVVALIVVDVPLHVRWRRAEPRFANAAQTVPDTPSRGWQPVPRGSIAGFPISEARRTGQTVWFHYSGSSADPLDVHTRYILFAPDGLPRSSRSGGCCTSWAVTDLGHGWYYVEDGTD